MRSVYQVIVIAYKKYLDEYVFLVLKRKDDNNWQFISGGGEVNETPEKTAVRESFEETNINCSENLKKLDSLSSIPKIFFNEHKNNDNLYVLPEYSFAVKVDNNEITLSKEHSEFKWLVYSEAIKVLKYDSNKTALWELNFKLVNNKII